MIRPRTPFAPFALLAFVILLLAAPLARAQTASLPGAPWSAEVAVAGGDEAERAEAQTIALRKVLLANSGDKTLLNRDEVRAALDDAERYVERFDYRVPPPGTVLARETPLTDAVRTTGEATRLLLVRFDRALLEALIAREPPPDAVTAEPSAPSDPFADVETALVWLLIEDGRRDIMIGDPAARIVRARAREIAGARGVTLVYPSGDEEDSAALGADELREARIERVRLASERYAASLGPAPVVLVGRLGRDGLDAWEGDWTRLAIAPPSRTLSSGEATPELPVESERFTTDSLDEALQAGLGWLSGAIEDDDGYRYGGEAGSSTEALVWIGPLDSVDAYASAMRFLEGVPGVVTVYPKEADERGTAFTVIPRDALPAIASSAESLSWLRRTSPPVSSPAMAVGDGRDMNGRGFAGSGGGTRAGEDPRFVADNAPDVTPGDGSGTGSPDARFPAGGIEPTRADARPSRRRSSGRDVPEYRSLAPNAELAFEYLR